MRRSVKKGFHLKALTFLVLMLGLSLVTMVAATDAHAAEATEAVATKPTVLGISILRVGVVADAYSKGCTPHIWGPYGYWWGFRYIYDGCAITKLKNREGTLGLSLALSVVKKVGGPYGWVAEKMFWNSVVPELYKASQSCGGYGAELHASWWNPWQVTRVNGC